MSPYLPLGQVLTKHFNKPFDQLPELGHLRARVAEMERGYRVQWDSLSPEERERLVFSWDVHNSAAGHALREKSKAQASSDRCAKLHALVEAVAPGNAGLAEAVEELSEAISDYSPHPLRRGKAEAGRALRKLERQLKSVQQTVREMRAALLEHQGHRALQRHYQWEQPDDRLSPGGPLSAATDGADFQAALEPLLAAVMAAREEVKTQWPDKEPHWPNRLLAADVARVCRDVLHVRLTTTYKKETYQPGQRGGAVFGRLLDGVFAIAGQPRGDIDALLKAGIAQLKAEAGVHGGRVVPIEEVHRRRKAKAGRVVD